MSPALSDAQHVALCTLATVLPEDAYLAGGVAIALRIGHRRSLFTLRTDPESLVGALTSRTNVRVTTRQYGTVYLEVEGVPVSIIRHAYPLLDTPECVGDLGVPMAGLADLTVMKIQAICLSGWLNVAQDVVCDRG